MRCRPVAVTALVATCLGIAVFGGERPAEEQRKGTVRGLVVGEDGKPIAGARVRALRLDYYQPLDPFAPALDAATDAQGRFEAALPPGDYAVHVVKGTLAIGGDAWKAKYWKVEPSKTLDVRIPAVKGARVKGTVVREADHTPVAAAKVMLRDGQATVTDAGGHFTLDGVCETEGALHVVAPGLADTDARAEPDPDAPTEVRIEMAPGYTVEGKVTDEAGRPIAGARVARVRHGIAPGWSGSCLTNAEGKYALPGFSREGDERSVWVIHRDFATAKHEFTPPKQGETLALDVQLGKGLAVEGHVRNPEGKPVEGAEVEFGFAIDPHYRTRTDAKGFFRLDCLAEASGALAMSAKGFPTASQRVKPGRGGAVPKLDTTLVPGRAAKGRVVDRKDGPIAGASVQVMVPDPGPSSDMCRPVSAETDRDGRFVLDGLPDGQLLASVEASGYTEASKCRLTTTGENTIVLDPPGTIVGKVLDEQTGQPLAAFNVKLDTPARSRAPDEKEARLTYRLLSKGVEFRSADGTFTIPSLTCGGAYAVIASAEGYAPSRVEPVVAQPADWDGWPVVVKLGKGRRVSGTVVDAETGRAVGDAEVFLTLSHFPPQERFYMQYVDDPRHSTLMTRKLTSGADGRFDFQHVAASGDLTLVVRTGQHAIQVVKAPATDKPNEVRLARGGIIVGTAHAMGGQGGKKLTVEAEGAGLNLGHLPVAQDGTFRIERLPAGDWSLTLMEDWTYKQKARVKVESGGTTQLDFAKLPGFTIRGRVTRGANGFPGLSVSVLSEHEWFGSATTDDDGRYTIRGISPGERCVTIERGDRPGRIGLHSERWIEVTDKDVSVDFAVGACRIEGRLLDAANGKPLAGASVHAMLFEKPDAPPNRQITLYKHEGRWGFGTSRIWRTKPALLGLRAMRDLSPTPYVPAGHAESAADGSFLVENLDAGDYTLFVSHRELRPPGFVPGIRIARDGDTAKVEANIRRDGGFRVRVLASDTRQPIAGARFGLCTAAGVHLIDYRHVRKPGVPEGKAFHWDDYTTEPFKTDAQGNFALDGLQHAEYGLWVVAPGFGARFVAPVPASPQRPETTIELDRSGVLVLRPTPEALKGVPNAHLAYRICDAAGRPVHPGGETGGVSPDTTGVAKLFDKERPEWRVDTLAPGRYRVEWEIHQCPEPKPGEYWRTLPAVHRGKAEVEVRKGEETVVVLSPLPSR